MQEKPQNESEGSRIVIYTKIRVVENENNKHIHIDIRYYYHFLISGTDNKLPVGFKLAILYWCKFSHIVSY